MPSKSTDTRMGLEGQGCKAVRPERRHQALEKRGRGAFIQVASHSTDQEAEFEGTVYPSWSVLR